MKRGEKRGRKASEELDLSDEDLQDDEDDHKTNDEDLIRRMTIINQATPEQKRRYNEMMITYFYSNKDKKVKEPFENLLKNILGYVPTEDICLATSTAAKMYVGELVETALMVAKERGEVGHVTPSQLQESRRRLKKTMKRIL
jgi:transcription initiation factor TFIID subunit 11